MEQLIITIMTSKVDILFVLSRLYLPKYSKV